MFNVYKVSVHNLILQKKKTTNRNSSQLFKIAATMIILKKTIIFLKCTVVKKIVSIFNEILLISLGLNSCEVEGRINRIQVLCSL